MLKIKSRLDRGDTLIEVLFAVSVFSLVAVGSLSLMNQGSNTSQRALEITLVRNQIDAQAETLRFLHDSYVSVYQSGISYSADTPSGQWALMLANIKATNIQVASTFGDLIVCPSTPPNGSFIINTSNAKFVTLASAGYKQADTYSKIDYDSIDGQTVVKSTEGIWIEAVRSGTSVDTSQSNVGFIDFHIRACWNSTGLSVPMTIGTIVRLYEPRA